MLIHARSKDRPFDLGPFPLEILPRDDTVIVVEAARAQRNFQRREAQSGPLADAAARYRDVFQKLARAEPARARAPVPDDPARRAVDIRGAAYFMDASQVGICRIPANAWLAGADADTHEFGVVILIEHGRVPDPGNLARPLVEPAVGIADDMRAGEIAVCLAGHIRIMGWQARAHIAGHEALDLDRMTVLAGLAVRKGDALVNPFVGTRFSVAVVSTDYELRTDLPLAAGALRARGLRYWWGINGAQSGRERNRRAARPSHQSKYPMETVRRVERPTTLILDEEVPRVPKRAAFFERALRGDLGDKAQKERTRFAFKHPLSQSQLRMIRLLVPFQNGEVAATAAAERARWSDPAANARAIKALSYYLGADLTGICEIPRYAWFSHGNDGEPITPYHRYAVVMLIDQGFDTLEGSSGDDWMSGALSMRAYLRGAVIAGVMADVIRAGGFPARSQTNADSDVLQLPLMLAAGLGEMSRIGEVVLNPFVGPRLKTVVLTTDLPLEADRPIDFGLQKFCEGCWKCARECPCGAIPLGEKVMFNGYEVWKPDVERCARYRLTNARGSACGRCMKTCPLNKVVDADGPVLTRAASWLGINAMFLKPVLVPFAAWFDDWIGNGRRNPGKKWWFDHEIVDGVTVAAGGTNERDIDLSRSVDPSRQKMAYFHASMMPPPDAPDPVPVDRKAALAAAALIETPAAARERAARGGAAPLHYRPTPPLGTGRKASGAVESPYKTK